MTKTQAEDLGDLLENLGETFSIRFAAKDGKERQFQVIGGPRSPSGSWTSSFGTPACGS
jgi:hypothetical protein